MPTAPTAPIGLKAALREALRTKSGLVGFAMIIFLVGLSLGVPFYSSFEAISAWGSTSHWLDNPRGAQPEWIGVFTGKHLPPNIIIEKAQDAPPRGDLSLYFRKSVVPLPDFGYTFIRLTQRIPFRYDDFPSELSLSAWTTFGQNGSLLTVTLQRPDGENITLLRLQPQQQAPTPNVYYLSSVKYDDADVKNLQFNMKDWLASKNLIDPATINAANLRPEVVLFSVLEKDMLTPGQAKVLLGDYILTVDMFGFRLSDDLDARFIAYGQVFGLAGTDTSRRDLLVGLLWGAPVALAFGSAAALVVVLVEAILGAASGWYGGTLDEVVQRGSDFFLIVPILPLLIILSIFYRPGLVTILLVVVAFGVLGSTSKIVRSIVIQLKEEQFIEAARSYGASRSRILIRYLMPRVMPYTFALIALNVPAYIFLEASLDFLGLGDPSVPTWGGILGNAYTGGALYRDIWWWVAFPAAGILFAAVAFSLLGYAFDKVLNPRLREE